MACEPDTSSEIVGQEAGARTCLHVRPERLTMLDCRFNKTTHHPKHLGQSVLSAAGGASAQQGVDHDAAENCSVAADPTTKHHSGIRHRAKKKR